MPTTVAVRRPILPLAHPDRPGLISRRLWLERLLPAAPLLAAFTLLAASSLPLRARPAAMAASAAIKRKFC